MSAVTPLSRVRQKIAAVPVPSLPDAVTGEDGDMSDEVVADDAPEPTGTAYDVDALWDDSVPQGKRTELQSVIAQVAKVHGPHVLRRATQKAKFIHIPTNVFTLDMGLHGGIPQSLISMFYGWESCLAADTPLKYIVVDPDTRAVQNSKGGSIETLYRRFHRLPGGGKGGYQRFQTRGSKFYVMSINDENRIIRNEVADVVRTGVKPCFRVTTTGGFSVEATADHRFFVGDHYVRLDELQPGAIVYVHANTPYKGRAAQPNYPVTTLKWYYAGTPKSPDGIHSYYQQPLHRLSFEAGMNDLTLDAYKDMLNSGIDKLPTDWWTIPEGFHVHHKDDDRRNWSFDNLELLDPSAHGRHHAERNQDNLRFMSTPDTVLSIEPVGDRETYDVKCFVPFNNYVAAGFVTHNCGKTTLAQRVMAAAQRKYPDMVVVLIDAEGTYDPLWGKMHGIDNERLILCQPDSGEQAVDIARAVIKTNEVSLVVIDSLPALMPAKEMDKSAEDEIVALSARLIGRMIRAVSQSLIDERRREHYPAVLAINQFRNKIQLMGDPRTLPGGNAIKFFVSVRAEIKNKEVLGKDKYESEIVELNNHSWTITKNKLGNGMRNGEFVMIRNPDHPLGAGFIDDAKPVLTFAKKFGLLTGGGSSWYLDGFMGLDDTKKPMRFGKLQEVMDCLYSDLEYYDNLKVRLIAQQRVNNGLSGTGWI